MCSVALVVAIACSALAARAQVVQQPAEEIDRLQDPGRSVSAEHVEPVEPGWLERDHAFGGWWGARDGLAERGIVVHALLTAEASRVLEGGVDTGRTATRHLFDLQAQLHSEPLWGWEGGEVMVLFQQQDGDPGSELVGDAQGYSNIDADGRTQLSRLWYGQELADGALWLKLGKIDANADFAYVDNGASFIGSAMGYSPTILGLPTYPDPSFGGELFVESASGLSLGLGVFDGSALEGVPTGERGPESLLHAAGDLFWIAEFGLRWQRGVFSEAGRVGLGAWHHGGTFERFDGGSEDGSQGAYLVLDQTLVAGGRELPALAGYLQLGVADPEVSTFGQHLGLGLVAHGRLLASDADALGLALSVATFSDAPGAPYSAGSETVVELFASFAFAPWLRVKPDLQFIDEPGGLGDLEDALVATLRATASF